MTLEGWLDAHPYLRPLAAVAAQVDGAAARLDAAPVSIPDWDDYTAEFEQGVPLLQSADAGVDFQPAGRLAVALVEALAPRPLPPRLSGEIAGLAAALAAEPQAPSRVAAWLLGDESFVPSHPGLLRYLGWRAAARHLAPLVAAFDGWRGEERWQRRYCPTCGSLPAMALLVGIDPGRKRFLSCGGCGTLWRYPRTGCPFCDLDAQRVEVLAVEGEPLRIDYCASCRGYLKTCVGPGHEDIFLADWTSLHLDAVARGRGLQRLASSLYDSEPALVSEASTPSV